MFIIEKETPAPGGWQKSKFNTVAECVSNADAEKFLEVNGYEKAGSEFDIFWHAPEQWPWDRYRIKSSDV